MNDASTDTGSARPVMTVERHELRNRKTTSTVSSAPSISASCDVAHRVARRARRRRGRRRARRRRAASAGSRRPARAIASATCGGAVALRLLDVDADGFLAVEERQRARLLGAVARRRRPRRAGRAARRARRRRAARSPRRLEPAAQPDRALVELAVEPADRRREVLRLQRLHDLRRR